MSIMIGRSNYKGKVEVSYVRDLTFQDYGRVRSSMSVSEKLRNILDTEFGGVELREVSFGLYLSRAHDILGWSVLCVGDLGGVQMPIYQIARNALLSNAAAVIIVHNHPSGNLNPSHQDHEITKKVKQGLETIDVQLLDHVIVTRDGYYSFEEEGDMP